MIVVLSDEQLERIEDALQSAGAIMEAYSLPEQLARKEIEDALGIVKAARALLAA